MYVEEFVIYDATKNKQLRFRTGNGSPITIESDNRPYWKKFLSRIVDYIIPNKYYKGTIYGIRIWNRVLSEKEIEFYNGS